jgi:hypothetical protein
MTGNILMQNWAKRICTDTNTHKYINQKHNQLKKLTYNKLNLKESR